MLLDTSGLRPLDATGLTPVTRDAPRLDAGGLIPLDASGLKPLAAPAGDQPFANAAPQSDPQWGGYASVIGRSAGRSLTDLAGATLKGAQLALQPADDPTAEETARHVQAPVFDNALKHAGERVQKYGAEQFPLTPTEQGSITSQAVRGVTSMAPVAALSLVAPAVGLPLAAATFGLSSASDAYDAAKAKGASDDDAAAAAGWSGAIGVGAGVLPIGAILRPVMRTAPSLAGWAAGKIQQAVQSGVTFATVGEAQHYLGQEVAKAYYDPQASYSPDVKRYLGALLAGGVLGVAHPLAAQPSSSRAQMDEFLRQAEATDPAARDRAAAMGTAMDVATGRRDNLDVPQLPPPDGTAAQAEASPPPAQAPPVQPPPIDPQRAVLRAYGYNDAQIDAMSPPQRQAEQQNAVAAQIHVPQAEPIIPAPEGAPASNGGVNPLSGPAAPGQPVSPAVNPIAPPDGASPIEQALQGANAGVSTPDVSAQPAQPLDTAGLTPVAPTLISSPSNEAAKTDMPPGEPSGRHQLQALLDDPRSADEIRADHAAARQEEVAAANWQATAEWQPVPARLDPASLLAGIEVRTEGGKPVARIAPDPGTRETPIALNSPEAVHAGAEITNPNPTPAQAEAGNYQKRHLKWQGFDIAIETEAGAERVGKDGSWRVTMPVPYGHVLGIKGADGDPLDMSIGPNPNAKSVFVIDQVDPDTRKFDEHKTFQGFDSADHAQAAYDASFSDGSGPFRSGAITELSVPQFKAWARNADKKKPVAYTPPRAAPKRAVLSLGEFLASRGGIKDHGGELAYLGLDKHFIPGIGRLVRATGMDLDHAREAAAELGYLPDQNGTTRDLLDLLAQEARGQKAYSSADVHAAQDRERKRAERADNEQFEATQTDVRDIAKEHKAALTDAEVREIATLALVDGMDAADAFVQILERGHYAASDEAVSYDSPQEHQDERQAANGPAAAYQGRAGQPQARQQPARPAGEAAAGVAPHGEQPGRAQPDRGQAAAPEERNGAAEAVGSANQSTANPPKPAAPRTPSVPTKTSEQTGTAPEPAPAPHTPAAPKPPALELTGAEHKPIEDFGEKIEGARKDTFAGFRDSLRENVDVVSEPLAKSFPQPNYEKLAEGGVSKRVLAHIAIMRDMIPNRPRVAWKAKQWATQVETLRTFARQLLDGDIDVAKFEQAARGNRLLDTLPLTAEAIEGIAPADLPRAAQYRVNSGSYSMLNGQRYSPSKTFWFLEAPDRRMLRNPLSNDPANPYTYRETAAETVALAKKIIASELEKKPGAEEAAGERSKYTDVGIYRDRTTGKVYLGLKVRSTVIRLKAGFETPQAAREYRDENRDELQATIDAMRKGPNMRGTENRPRSGEALREGDVAPELFSETFGFRGVQFGNYVEGPRRQADLNRAFDALMDLADVLAVPPRALSLNGELGLAFGARGTGGRNAAAAHYEPGRVVINLTKGGGPGSLAHEWLHALDNYFARQDKAGGYISERRRDTGPVRDEVYQAWKNVEATLQKGGFAERSAKFDEARAKPYWNTTIEKAARAFERYMIDRLAEKGAVNDYLANIDTSGGAYPTVDEMKSLGIKAAFDRLFETIETRDTERGVALFDARRDLTPEAHAARPQIEQQLTAVVRGIVGDNVHVEFPDKISLRNENTEAWGSMGQGRRTAAGVYYPADKLIRVALADPGYQHVASTTLHESFHAVEHLLLTDAELAVLKRAEPRLREIAKNYLKMKPDEAEGLADFEVRAIAFEAYAHARAEGEPIGSFPAAVRAILEKLRNLFERIRSALSGLGFKSVRDVFSDVFEGRMAKREPNERPIGRAAASLRPTSETVHTADGPREQLVIPGAEKIADKTLAERRAAEPKRSGKVQKGTEGLPLFGDDAKQGSLFSMGQGGDDGLLKLEREQREQSDRRLRARLANVLAPITSKLVERVQDLSRPVHELQNELEARRLGTFPDEQDFYTKKRLFPGMRATEVDEFNKAHLDPLVDQMRKDNISLADASLYLYARHAAERNAHIDKINPEMKGAGSGMTDEQALSVLDGIAPAKRAAYQDLSEKVAGIRDHILDTMEKGGLEKPDVIKQWREQYDDYVPLRGYEDAPDDAPSNYRPAIGFNVRGKEVQPAFGRRSRADNPIVNLLDQAYRTIERAERNRYLRAFDLAMNSMDPKEYADIAIRNRGVLKREIDPQTGMVRSVETTPNVLAPNVVSLKIGGNPVHWVFKNAEIAQAVKRMSPEGLGMFQWALDLQNKLKAIWTHYSPDFLARHFLARYPIEGTLNSFEQKATGAHSAMKYAADAVPFLGHASRAIFARNKGKDAGEYGRYWDEMRQHGGAMTFRSMRDMELLREHLQTQLMSLKGKPIKSLRQRWRKTIEAMDTITNALDNSLRLAAYVSARKQGKTPQQAALIAREATVDFQLKGKWASAIGLWFPFGNVAIQTSARMTKAVSRSKIMRRVFMGTLLAGFLTAMFNYLVGGNDKDGVPFFDKLPEWDKRLNFIIMNPFDLDDKGRPLPIKIPMPYNWALPLAMGYAFGNMVFGTLGVGKSISLITHAMLESLTPFGSEHNKLNYLSPELGRPFVHVATNQKFSGSPIHVPSDTANARFGKNRQIGPNAETPWKRPTPDQNVGEGWKMLARGVNVASGGSSTKSGALDFYPEDYKEVLGYVVGTPLRFGEEVTGTAASILKGEQPKSTNIPLGRVFRGTDYDAADRFRKFEQSRSRRQPWLSGH